VRITYNFIPYGGIMKFLKFLLLMMPLVFIGQAQAIGWKELKPFVVTDATPIIFSPKDNTLVLQDPTGSISIDEALRRKEEFRSPAEMGPVEFLLTP
jgi:hypothetical protein